jgi:hypothetical protein
MLELHRMLGRVATPIVIQADLDGLIALIHTVSKKIPKARDTELTLFVF